MCWIICVLYFFFAQNIYSIVHGIKIYNYASATTDTPYWKWRVWRQPLQQCNMNQVKRLHIPFQIFQFFQCDRF